MYESKDEGDRTPEEADLAAPVWESRPLGHLPGVASVTYGIVKPGPHRPAGVPLLQAGNIGGGVVDRIPSKMIDEAVHRSHPRTSLVMGDLVVVLVGRIGDAAIVDAAQQGWNTARSVGVVRCTEAGQRYGINTWLKWWLRTPEVRARHLEGTAGAEHSTLPVTMLAGLPVPLPPLDLRMRLLRTMSLVERRMELNTRIAASAMELADAHFAGYVERNPAGNKDATGPAAAIADLAEVVGGTRRPDGTRRSDAVEGGVPAAWATPTDVFRHKLAYFDRADQNVVTPPHTVCAPGTILVAPRPGGVETVVSRIPLVPARGLLALRIAREADRVWLLHELRSRSKELVSTAQGQQAREMSLRAFSRFTVSWPDSSGVREPFARIAMPLHERADAALEENRVLELLITTELTDLMKVAERSKDKR
ncbi:hypothetical protein [Streptomyces beigongshangae]|uniref:hypothetical protein n=1 Tax=Streptomyces beigongshangae TaxID=2841597 RepID=UPI001C85C912|nr:hypothetical protein [Streptomyces sp. REN17]